MTTILVFSDSHGCTIPAKLEQVAKESDYVFFLGDGINHLGDLLLHKNFVAVQGNCDLPVFKDEEILEIEGVKILLTHGHKYHVKNDLLSLFYHAKELNCNLVLYGHTHFAKEETMDQITLINPGSLSHSYYSEPSYLYLVLANGKITSKIVKII